MRKDWCRDCRRKNRPSDCEICQGRPMLFTPLKCEHCGGQLSEIRYHNGKEYRHCFSCHFEFMEDQANETVQLMTLATAASIKAKFFPIATKDCNKVFNVCITEREI